jgi:hypothetical protein
MMDTYADLIDRIEPIHEHIRTFDSEDGREVSELHIPYFPRFVGVTSEMLLKADRRFIQPDEGGFTVVATNGRARYRFIHNEPRIPGFICERED